jgi:nitroreductase
MRTHDPHASRAAVLKGILTRRRSVRRFTQDVLAPEHLAAILEAGVHAPSGSNAQNQRFLVIDDPDEKKTLGAIRFVWPYPGADKARTTHPSGLIGGAATVILVFADAALSDQRDNGEYYVWESLELQNCAASIQNMLNMATALGVGSCWLSASERMTGTRLLSGQSWARALARYDVPPWYKIQGIVILGYPKAGCDESGFPIGDAMHGATHWAPTARRALPAYLIGRRQSGIDAPRLTARQRLTLRLFSRANGVLLTLLGAVQRGIYDLEVRQALKHVHSTPGTTASPRSTDKA